MVSELEACAREAAQESLFLIEIRWNGTTPCFFTPYSLDAQMTGRTWDSKVIHPRLEKCFSQIRASGF